MTTIRVAGGQYNEAGTKTDVQLRACSLQHLRVVSPKQSKPLLAVVQHECAVWLETRAKATCS